ncbi:metallophosphoesterase [Nakamurella flavida]|uniref:Metallophosphoesterase n=1 Tax=Nakamurella flavida TaxID=363630 RepID=A0A939C5D9_9ACTN|nr:metallophosphoesterase [Nakamurella flavida]MBM9476087.1 metallophosphoesterase [Nakamurella flavida]MDP9777168.1 Icc-related predicted phosphoesterase [Nakamurella flavida]
MRLSFVSDIHGNIEGLARVAERVEHLIVLGDLLDYVDYHDPAGGILGTLFGAEKVRHFTALRTRGDFTGLRTFNRGLWESIADPAGTLAEVVSGRYREVLAAVGPDTLLTLGNVDVASVWTEVAGDTLPYLDGQVVEIGGRRLGFVAGGASSRPAGPRPPEDQVWQPLVRPAAEYRASIDAVFADGPVDVLCTHIPPDIAALRYDVVPARLEMPGPGLVEAIDRWTPRLSVFGHVHQPLARRLRRGRTECVNVGHFQRYPRAFEIDLD